MSKTLWGLFLSCLDEFDRLQKLQELLELALEQLDDFSNSPEKVINRLELLIGCYVTFAEQHLDQMQADLGQIRKQFQESSD